MNPGNDRTERPADSCHPMMVGDSFDREVHTACTHECTVLYDWGYTSTWRACVVMRPLHGRMVSINTASQKQQVGSTELGHRPTKTDKNRYHLHQGRVLHHVLTQLDTIQGQFNNLLKSQVHINRGYLGQAAASSFDPWYPQNPGYISPSRE